MNKKAKIIITILSFVIVFLLIIIIVLLNDRNISDTTNKTNTKEEKKAIGIYHTSNWNKHEATLELNKNNNCKYPNSNDICKWEISDDTIKITTSYYEIDVTTENGQELGLPIFYNSLESCNEGLSQLNNEYENPKCTLKEKQHEATLVNEGVLLYDTIFNKIK